MTTETTEVLNTETPAPVTERPANVPEQFWNAETGAVNVEALLAAVAPAPVTEETPPVDPPVTEETPPVDPPVTTPAFGEITEAATAELAEKGELSEETVAKFESMGVSKDVLTLHIQGQQAMFELRKIHAEREVGGEEQYQAILDWAGANYTREQAEAFNNAVYGGNKDAAMAAVRALKQTYEDTMGTDGKIVTQGMQTQPATGGYASKTEWLADLKSPEYRKNEAFRETVRRKLDISMRNGVNLGLSASAR